MRILAIETSCDETAMALVEATGGLAKPRFRVVENLVTSQIEVHRPWGGVVPNLAKREHEKNLPLAFKTLERKIEAFNPDLLAVTAGPGLEPALWTGIEFAKALHKELAAGNGNIRLVGANHLEGHLFSFLLPGTQGGEAYARGGFRAILPAIALVISGGHTIILRLDSPTKRKKLGETRDDAVGEAFDKVAKMLGLPYPGGPEIQRAAERGNPAAIPFPRPMLHSKDYDFSFSGLKTSVLYYVRDHKQELRNAQRIADIAASFQAAAVDVLTGKTVRAAREHGARSILLSGGVAANSAVRASLAGSAARLGIKFLVPPLTFNTDNATMIAAAAYLSHLRKKKYPLRANGTMSL
jgi:N6-L-threonylcarbamoyladenine synthase